jgi:glutamate-5-semialdehyde dehydrogenase
MAVALESAAGELIAANAEDVHAASLLSGSDQLAAATKARLKLDDAKLREMVEQVRSVAALPDPLGRVLDAVELDDTDGGLHMQKISVPLGVLAVIFEARPDAVTQIASLALKSGNSVILKPGREVERTAMAMVRVLRTALAEQGLPTDAVSMVAGREAVAELLGMHGLIDMAIPRGSKALVEYVQANTRIPVLGHAEGVCHIYVDRAADEALATRVIDDAKTDYPAVCNAVETVLVHREIAAEFLPKLAERLLSRGVVLHGDATVKSLLRDIPVADVDDWHTEYGDLAISIGVVPSLDAAIEHIHAYGSSHTESIITSDTAAAEKFLREVDAAGVFHNISTRFADGFRYGFGAEVGVSTSKFHARGPVGLDGLTTYKYVVRGHGHIAGDYRGAGGRSFTHKREAKA